MSNKIYNITFVGQDYQPVEAAKPVSIFCDGKPLEADDDLNKSDSTVFYRILQQFLDDVAPNGKCNREMVVNARGSEKKLYDSSFGPEGTKGYFCGIVGVIKKQIKMSFDSNNEQGENSKKEFTFNVTLQIKSRLDKDSNNKPSKPYFLSTMLLSDKFELNDNTVPNSEDDIFEYLLLFWFKEKLQQARLKGYFKTYRRFEKNDDRIKGTIDISRHIKQNMGMNNAKVAYSYRENTVNNYLNLLVVNAYKHLRKKYPELVANNFDDELKSEMQYLDSETGFAQVDKNYLINKNLKPISHPYFVEYEFLRIICLKILRDEGLSIFDGTLENETQGILFYLPDLWELYLEREVISKALPENITCKSQFKVYNFGYKAEGETEYSYVQETRPDYVFFSGKKPFFILDAKFKPKWECVFHKGSLSVILNDYDKCLRDMVSIKANATGVIFPTNKTDDINDTVLIHSVSAYNPDTLFYTIPVQVPYVNPDASYSEYLSQFKTNLNRTKSTLNVIVNNLQK